MATQEKGRRDQDERGAGSDRKKHWLGEMFHRFAHAMSTFVGLPWAFGAAVLLIAAWAVTGPVFQYSDSWQLVINTATTIVTFLMVFLIQNTQNRDAKALHLKLDELIHALQGPRDQFVDLEDLSDEELARLKEQFARIAKEANGRLK